MLKYFHSLISSKKEKRSVEKRMYESLSKEQRTKLHNKYDVIIFIRKPT